MSIHKILQKLPEETAHNIALHLLKYGMGYLPFALMKDRLQNPALNQNLWNIHFRNPIGLAGGFDKNGIALNGLVNCGFGFIEVGTTTPKPQAGNPKPRIFRITDYQAIINRMGFPNLGMDYLYENIKNYRHHTHTPLLVNIGCNKDSTDQVDDYVRCAEKLQQHADILVVNVSSPNTPGLRDKQKPEYLAMLLQKIQSVTNKIILVKLSPDMAFAQIAETTEAALKNNAKGLILTNTTITRHDVHHPRANESGGMSGQPLFEKSTRIVGIMHDSSKGRIPVIGVGGIMNAQDAITKIRAGASLIQVYSGLIYAGMSLISDIHNQLGVELANNKMDNISQLVGVDSGQWR